MTNSRRRFLHFAVGAAALPAMSRVVRAASFPLDIRSLDDGPPFLDFGLLERAECFRRLLLAWWNLPPRPASDRSARRPNPAKRALHPDRG
jgi:hypothetical protein